MSSVFQVVERLVDQVALVLVTAVDERRDLGARREDRLDVAADHRGEVVHRVDVHRRAGRDRASSRSRGRPATRL
jgi:hypothetical protein